jgi:glycosyltransferase involved in cell wall biosynthesis
MKLSFVIPLFNERETLAPLAQAIVDHAGEGPFNILFVDDGSTDGSAAVLEELNQRDPRMGYIRFRRNLGKTAALAAGFAHADGDLIFTLDADLQDDPAEIPRFLEKLDEGYDLVTGWKKVRYDPWHKRLASRVYNSVVGRLFGLKLHDVNCGYKLMRREVMEHITLYGDLHRLIPVLAWNLGYRVAEIPVQHHPRRYGRSKYGFERFVRGALDTFTVWFLHRHSQSPGRVFAVIGLFLASAGLICATAGIILLGLTGKVTWGIVLSMLGFCALQAGITALGLALVGELLLRQVARPDTNSYVTGRILPFQAD